MVNQTPTNPSPMSARRRRGHLISMHTPTDSLAQLEANNDEEERRQRKRSILLSNNLLSPIAGHTTPTRSRASIGMTYAQLREHNANCIKLSSENKINAKNAFALHLIDYMKVLVSQSQKDDTTNFQSASCTLDAGVKIYAGRVDSVHADAFKILGSLGRATVEEDGGGGNNEEQSGENEKQQKKKKAIRGPGKTIEKNLKALNCESFDLTFEVDPFFHKTSATFDEGGTSGLLLNHLLVKDETYELALDSQTEILRNEEPAAQSTSDAVNLSAFKDITSRIFDTNIEICPQFRDFLFTEWDKGSHDLLLSQTDKSLPSDENHRFDQDASIIEPDADEPGPDYVSDGEYSGAPDDDEMSNGGGMEPIAINEVMPAKGSFRGDGPINGFGPLGLEIFLQPNEYSYFRQEVLDAWAGPLHWKLKGKSANAKSNEGDAAKKRRQKKVFTFTYDDESVIQGIEKKGKASKTLSKTTLKKMSTLKTTLPDDIHYDAESFLKLFIKPSVKVRRRFQTAFEGGKDAYDYNYNSRCDQDNFCPDLQNDDDDDDYGGNCDITNNNTVMNGDSMGNITHRGFDDTVGDQTLFAGDNLISQPNKVEKINIAYAKTAKRIDIKKLKRSIWETLDFTDNSNNEEDPSEASKRPTTDKHDTLEFRSFKDVYTALPGKLSQNATKNLSVPIAFVCMLYLANEKGLQLHGSENMDDFKVALDDTVNQIAS